MISISLMSSITTVVKRMHSLIIFPAGLSVHILLTSLRIFIVETVGKIDRCLHNQVELDSTTSFPISMA